MPHKLLSPRSDFIFKLIFGDQRNTDILAVPLWSWLKFFVAKDREELTMLSQTSVPMKKAVGKLMELSEDERTQMLEEMREKKRRDDADRWNTALQRGLAEGEAKGRAEGEAEGRVLAILIVLKARFGMLPTDLPNKVYQVTDLTKLDYLTGQAGLCENVESFEALL
jgi:flagellar biosynthesis/type III secretory pathway protein FliH